MSLLSRLREKHADKVATATPATFATQAWGERRTVASVATVTVAKSPQRQTASRWWLIHFANRDPAQVVCYPETTHAEMMKQYSDAIAVEPFTPVLRQPSAPMIVSEETAIRALLVQIEETDPATIAEVINQCQRDADAREFYLGLARNSDRGLFRQGVNDDCM